METNYYDENNCQGKVITKKWLGQKLLFELLSEKWFFGLFFEKEYQSKKQLFSINLVYWQVYRVVKLENICIL